MKNLVLIFALTPLFLSCERDSFNSSYDFMYGSWTTVSIDAGSIIEISDFCETMKFDKPNHYSLLVNNQEVEDGKFEIKEQIDQNLVIELNRKNRVESYQSLIHIYETNLDVTVFNNDSIRITNDATDGLYFSFWLSKE